MKQYKPNNSQLTSETKNPQPDRKIHPFKNRYHTQTIRKSEARLSEAIRKSQARLNGTKTPEAPRSGANMSENFHCYVFDFRAGTLPKLDLIHCIYEHRLVTKRMIVCLNKDHSNLGRLKRALSRVKHINDIIMSFAPKHRSEEIYNLLFSRFPHLHDATIAVPNYPSKQIDKHLRHAKHLVSLDMSSDHELHCSQRAIRYALQLPFHLTSLHLNLTKPEPINLFHRKTLPLRDFALQLQLSRVSSAEKFQTFLESLGCFQPFLQQLQVMTLQIETVHKEGWWKDGMLKQCMGAFLQSPVLKSFTLDLDLRGPLFTAMEEQISSSLENVCSLQEMELRLSVVDTSKNRNEQPEIRVADALRSLTTMRATLSCLQLTLLCMHAFSLSDLNKLNLCNLEKLGILTRCNWAFDNQSFADLLRTTRIKSIDFDSEGAGMMDLQALLDTVRHAPFVEQLNLDSLEIQSNTNVLSLIENVFRVFPSVTILGLTIHNAEKSVSGMAQAIQQLCVQHTTSFLLDFRGQDGHATKIRRRSIQHEISLFLAV